MSEIQNGQTGTLRLKTGLAEMLKGGVIMDVVTRRPSQDRRRRWGHLGHGAGKSARRHPRRRRRIAHVEH